MNAADRVAFGSDPRVNFAAWDSLDYIPLRISKGPRRLQVRIATGSC
jgi:hypothetical protein